MNVYGIFWGVFIAIFFLVFGIDMYVTDHRKGTVKIKNALMWTSIWITVALSYGVAIFFFYPDGHTKAFEYVTGYLTEYSLSVDNLFVFIMIFSVMGIREKNQPLMLKIGIIASIFLRVIFILFGSELINRFHYAIYIFGAILLYTAYKMLFAEDEEIDPEENYFYRLVSKYFPVETNPDVEHFFVRKEGKLHVTTLFLIFILIGTTDILFAFDSIPAIFGITTDPFIVITSNVFAVLGLISLFFALKGVMGMFRFLKQGVSFILLFVGIKMLISGIYHIPVHLSLIFIVGALLASILASLWIKEQPANQQ